LRRRPAVFLILPLVAVVIAGLALAI
ncbi:MAG: hypothetical protein JWQ20_4444, partial [Conexibacter sp.]|nr:hypothetical protein [Conexibacter sp.]